MVALISLFIPKNLVNPELTVSTRDFTTFRILNRLGICDALYTDVVLANTYYLIFLIFICSNLQMMSMLETTIYQNHRVKPPQDDIRRRRNVLDMQTISIAMSMQKTSHNHLWPRILAANSRHILMALFWR